jgi:hypothetical protein
MVYKKRTVEIKMTIWNMCTVDFSNARVSDASTVLLSINVYFLAHNTPVTLCDCIIKNRTGYTYKQKVAENHSH